MLKISLKNFLISFFVADVVLLLGVLFFFFFRSGGADDFKPAGDIPVLLPSYPQNNIPVSPVPQNNSPSQNIILPAQISINVPFVSQAPYRVWDYFHNESCEEASIVTVYAWTLGRPLTAFEIETELHKLADWERENFGKFEDTNARETAQMAEAVYGLKSRLITYPKVDDLKQELAKGNIIVMGMAGQLLENPYYTPPGPPYHMIVLRGYNDKGFFANDPGTNQIGNNFFFSNENIMESAHDWTGSKATIESGIPVALIFSKNQ